MRDNKAEIRLMSLLNHISYIQNDLKDVEYEDFVKSNLLIRATSFSIMQIGEAMKKIESLFKDKYPDLPWQKASAMRNYIVHDYDDANPKIVYTTATIDLEELRQGISQIYSDLLKEKQK